MMPSAIPVLIAAFIALLFWSVLGFALSRRFATGALALPLAPTLGWACHSALALPLHELIGFTRSSVTITSLALLAVAGILLLRPPLRGDGDPGLRLPLWTYSLAALLGLATTIAVFPKITGDAVTLAPAIFDHSKVAMIDEMTRLGVPAGNPFFGATELPLAYYYLWHFSAAELAQVFGISGWEADIALSGLTAFSSLTLMMGFAVWIGGRAAAGFWILPLCLAASLHPIVNFANAYQTVLMRPTGLAGWLFQTTWAPQHIASTSCALLAIYLMVQLAQRPSVLLSVMLALVTVAGYESSIWVGGLIFAAAALVAGIILLVDCRGALRLRFFAAGAGAALLALPLAYPFLRDQMISAAARGVTSPIAIVPYRVLAADIPDPLRSVLDIPGFWIVVLMIEFPAIYLPGLASLVARLRSRSPTEPVQSATKAFAGLLVISLLGAAFLTITFADNNDLGWRAILPGVFVLTIFAATGLARWLAAPISWAAVMTLVLLAAGLPESLRLIAQNVRGAPSDMDREFAQAPALWAAVQRLAAPDERVANNPLFLEDMTPWPVNISWALLSNRPSCFPTRELALPFAPIPRVRVDQLEDQFRRIFRGDATADDIRDMAINDQCRIVVLTAQDGAWNHDPFKTSRYYALAEESAGHWKIYRASNSTRSEP